MDWRSYNGFGPGVAVQPYTLVMPSAPSVYAIAQPYTGYMPSAPSVYAIAQPYAYTGYMPSTPSVYGFVQPDATHYSQTSFTHAQPYWPIEVSNPYNSTSTYQNQTYVNYEVERRRQEVAAKEEAAARIEREEQENAARIERDVAVKQEIRNKFAALTGTSPKKFDINDYKDSEVKSATERAEWIAKGVPPRTVDIFMALCGFDPSKPRPHLEEQGPPVEMPRPLFMDVDLNDSKWREIGINRPTLEGMQKDFRLLKEFSETTPDVVPPPSMTTLRIPYGTGSEKIRLHIFRYVPTPCPPVNE